MPKYLVTIQELGKAYASGRPRIFRQQVDGIPEAFALMQKLMQDGWKIRYMSIVHRGIKEYHEPTRKKRQ